MKDATQLERLAKPIPAGLIKQKPGSFAADYCDHEIITQILLAICGPFSFEVVEAFRNPDGLIDGCIARLTAEIDGRTVSVTEAGDCDQPEKKKSQGERLQVCASSAIKRCWMRLGLGLHLWAGEQDYFLYRHLLKNAEEGSRDPATFAQAAPSAASGTLESAPAAPEEPSGIPTPSDDNAARNSSGTPGPISKNQLGKLQSRVRALNAEKMGVSDRRIARGLPPLNELCSAEDLDNWDTFLVDLEAIRRVKA